MHDVNGKDESLGMYHLCIWVLEPHAGYLNYPLVFLCT